MAVLRANPHILCKDLCYRDQVIANSGYPSSSSFGHFSFPSLGNGKSECRKRRWRSKVSPHPFWPEISRPSSIEMEAVTGTEQFDEILHLTKENAQPIIVDWMAAWCRKCIHLKPKLEKLASEYHQRVKFYYVDVNKVPQSLVKRGNITLWKDGEMKEEVIGGHKAWMVVDEVRVMIEKHI